MRTTPSRPGAVRLTPSGVSLVLGPWVISALAVAATATLTSAVSDALTPENPDIGSALSAGFAGLAVGTLAAVTLWGALMGVLIRVHVPEGARRRAWWLLVAVGAGTVVAGWALRVTTPVPFLLVFALQQTALSVVAWSVHRQAGLVAAATPARPPLSL